jgi:hypothetical protein
MLLPGIASAESVQFAVTYIPGQGDTFGAFSFDFVLNSLPQLDTVFLLPSPVTVNGFTVGAACEANIGWWAFATNTAKITRCDSTGTEVQLGPGVVGFNYFTQPPLPGPISVPSTVFFSVVGGSDFEFGINGTGIIQTTAALPEPSSLFLLGIGLLVAVGAVGKKLPQYPRFAI